MVFPVLVADVDVREDSIFIRLRKEEVVCEDQDTSKQVSSTDVLEPVVEKGRDRNRTERFLLCYLG